LREEKIQRQMRKKKDGKEREIERTNIFLELKKKLEVKNIILTT
jgi:hypothetical protein